MFQNKKMKTLKTLGVTAVMLSGFSLFASAAYSATLPNPGDFAYVLYQIGVLNLLQGPAGIMIAVGGIGFAAFNMYQARIIGAALAFLASGTLLAASTIAISMGAIA